MEREKPKVVVLCGSSRFVDIMAVCGWIIERDEGAIVMGLHLLPEWYPDCPPDHLAEHEGCTREMDELHLRKIDMADEVFVVNWNGYVGDSTYREIKYAKAHGITVRWFTHDVIGEYVGNLYFASGGMPKKQKPESPSEHPLDQTEKEKALQLLEVILRSRKGICGDRYLYLPQLDAGWVESFYSELVDFGPSFYAIRSLQKEIHKNAVNHGWWENERPVPEILCLIHSEVSEALEAHRKSDKENFAEELADIAIRLMDAAEGYGIDLENEIVKKHEYNKTREYRHGGKAC